jgi:hypothetical protein
VIHQFKISKRSVTETKLFKATATPEAYEGYCIECDVCGGSSRSFFAILASTDLNGQLYNFGYRKRNYQLESQVHLRNGAVITASIEAVAETSVLGDPASAPASDSMIAIASSERSGQFYDKSTRRDSALFYSAPMIKSALEELVYGNAALF